MRTDTTSPLFHLMHFMQMTYELYSFCSLNYCYFRNSDQFTNILLHNYLPILPVSLVDLEVLLHPAFHHGPEVLVLLDFLSDLCLPFLLANLLYTSKELFLFYFRTLYSVSIHDQREKLTTVFFPGSS